MYPAAGDARDRFVLERRGPQRLHDPWTYQGLVVEEERTAGGTMALVATVFLTGRECPWRCVMCDLWRYTTTSDTPAGAIATQIAAARQALARQRHDVSQIKLYNAGSFFDPRAVPERDYTDIAVKLVGLSRVIVESHPSLIGPRVDRFLEELETAKGATPLLEVAMGLETVHPEALERLHKRMTVGAFARAAADLARKRVDLRVFLLVDPPFIPHDEQEIWLLRAVNEAFSCGASVVSLVPTRPGNGALEALAAEGLFRAPRLADVERRIEAVYEQGRPGGRVFVDLWDLERFADCERCFDRRRTRLHLMNLEQRAVPAIRCPHCNHGEAS
jgi:radical SAM enzyme (TIGR01210 family)